LGLAADKDKAAGRRSKNKGRQLRIEAVSEVSS